MTISSQVPWGEVVEGGVGLEPQGQKALKTLMPLTVLVKDDNQ